MRMARGFTLIELLVAMVIFSIVSLLAYKTLGEFIDSRQKLEEKSRHLADLQLAYVILGQDLEQLIARPINDEYQQVQGSFIAVVPSRGQFLEFSRTGQPNPTGLPRSSLQRVAYVLEDGQLLRKVWQQMDRTSSTVSHEGVLIDGVEEIEVRYMNKQGTWFVSWPQLDLAAADPVAGSLQFLPTAVEVKLKLQGMGELRWVFASEG